jgi:hypothetical protein
MITAESAERKPWALDLVAAAAEIARRRKLGLAAVAGNLGKAAAEIAVSAGP